MTPGMGGGQDPRMAQLMQGQGLPRTAIPKQSEDTELIQLIKMLTSLGIPMEQLRGRTKEELVEMLVSVKGKTGGQERPEVEEEVVEEEVVQTADGGRIGLFKGAEADTKGPAGGQAMSPGTSTTGGSRNGGGGGEKWSPGVGGTQHIPTQPKVKDTRDGIISKLQNWQDTSNLPKRTKFIDDLMYIPGMREKLLSQGIITEGEDDDYQNWQWAGNNPITDQSSLKQLQGIGYTGGMPTPGTGGGGGGGQTYSTAGGGGTGTTTPSGDDYYKFAEWDKWLMPGETTTQPLMPGGYKKEILANKGGVMRTGYALGHPVIPSKDGPQLDMRDQGGYQPHGKAEKHDDVRALLAQGEFVMTSDAVKGMGGGDREAGAQKMYNLMHNMEAMA